MADCPDDDFLDCEEFFIGDFDDGDGNGYDDPWEQPIDLDGNPLVSSPKGPTVVPTAAERTVAVNRASGSGDGGGASSSGALAGNGSCSQTEPGGVHCAEDVDIADELAHDMSLSQRLLANWHRRKRDRLLLV